MYQTILLPLDTSSADKAIIEHVALLARAMQSRVVLLHVVTSAQAVWNGPDAAGETVDQARAYLEGVRQGFEAAGVPAQCDLAFGEAAPEIRSCRCSRALMGRDLG